MFYIWTKEKKKNNPQTVIVNILGNFGWVVGINLMIMGFLFSNILGDATGPIFLILSISLIKLCCKIALKVFLCVILTQG